MILNHGPSTISKPIPGFTISLPEWEPTITTLWDSVKGNDLHLRALNSFSNLGDLEFAQENPQYIAANNSMDFLSNNGGQTYNLCHCESRALAILYRLFTYFSSDWSNFEIASLDFWRSKCKSILHSKSLLTERAIRRGVHIFLRIP